MNNLEDSDYVPDPLDLSEVPIPCDLSAEDLERLAKNVHENWARMRLAEGWRYGPRTDEASRTHSCLVPYEELPEAEKDYDRKIVSITLKGVCLLMPKGDLSS